MPDLLQSGVELMFIGMASVFLFLTMLVITTRWMSMLVMRYEPDQSLPPQSEIPSTIANSNDQLIAVISAAIHQHRSRQK